MLRDTATRMLLNLTRGTLVQADDAPKMQSVEVRALHDEVLGVVERFQNYGFSSVPKPDDGAGAAELIVAFIQGNRSHPVALVVDDRRYRPQNLQAGESALYDDQGQQVYVSRSGIQILGGASKLPVTVTVGGATMVVQDGTVTVTAANKVAVTAPDIEFGNGGTLQQMVTAAFMTLFNEHTHPANGEPPTQQMTDSELTSIVKVQ